MYRPVRSQLMLIILLALQTMTCFNISVLLAQEYSVEEQIHIDGLYVERDAKGASVYAQVDRFTAAKLSSSPNDRGLSQPQKYDQTSNNLHHHNQVGQAEHLDRVAHDQNYHDQNYLMQQQQQQQQQHHHHQQQQQHLSQIQQQVQQAQLLQQQPQQHHPNPTQQQIQQQGPHQLQEQPDHQPNHHYQPQTQSQQQQQELYGHHPYDHQQQVSQQQQHHQNHHQQQQQQPHNHAHNFHSSNNEAQQQQHQSYELQQSQPLQLQFLYREHHQQIQSHIYQHTQIVLRSESIHDIGAGVGFSEFYMHNLEATYPIAGDNYLSQHRASSCDSIDDTPSLFRPKDFVVQPTCEATSGSSRIQRDVSDHVPKFAAQPGNNNKPSRNSNVESFPLAPQHYQYDSSLMTAIRHYWREISGLCLASAIFLNWLFVVIKRKFFASGLTRQMADVGVCEHAVEPTHHQRLSSSSSTATPPSKSISKETLSTFNNSAHDSAFEENASPISLDDVDDTSQESSLSSRPRSVSSTPYGLSVSQPSSSLNNSSYTFEYISRYSSDFDSIRRLGRGGFGIVFEAKNKIDDCHYAVKRICLPLEKEARERVMREVRALAKLDHAGIVRYYNAWLETPPDEWLKQHDALLGIVHTRDGLSFPSTDGHGGGRNDSDLNNAKGFNIGDKFGESGDISNLDFLGNNTKSPFDTRNRTNGYSSDYLKGNSSSPSLDIVFEGSGSIRLEAENNTEKSEIKVASPGIHLEKVYLYIQMQLCRKDTLKDWLRTNCENRDKTTIFDFFYQIVDAVEYVHSQDLIHRDLKPSNIFFSLDGTLKIGDFGLCRAKTNTCVGSSLDLKEYAADFSEAVHTEQVGTQLYMSPEQMNGLSYNHKVDIFAMGLILLELLIPFRTQMQRVNVLLKARTNMFSREFIRDHPDEHELVRSLLDRRPHKRPTASAIKEHDLLANAQLSQPVIERIYHRRRTISSNSSSE